MDEADDDHVEGLIRAGMIPDHKDKLEEGQLGGKLNQLGCTYTLSYCAKKNPKRYKC